FSRLSAEKETCFPATRFSSCPFLFLSPEALTNGGHRHRAGSTWSAVSQERSYASYPQSRRRSSSGTVVATRLSTSGLSTRETLLSHAPQARLTNEAVEKVSNH